MVVSSMVGEPELTNDKRGLRPLYPFPARIQDYTLALIQLVHPPPEAADVWT
jgi:hypothetical protein